MSVYVQDLLSDGLNDRTIGWGRVAGFLLGTSNSRIWGLCLCVLQCLQGGDHPVTSPRIVREAVSGYFAWLSEVEGLRVLICNMQMFTSSSSF